MDYIPMLALGAIFLVLGCFNIKGNISSIHWYNRRKVLPEDVPQIFFETEGLYYITVAGAVIGLGFMLYGQFKYNHGIF